MVAAALPRFDKEAIRAALDCRDIVERYLGPGHKVGKAVQYRNPDTDQRTGSFTVYSNGYKDFDAASDEKGDVFALIMKLDRCDFSRAVEIAAGFAGMSGVIVPDLRVLPRTVPASPQPAVSETKVFQAAASELVARSERNLWSGTPEANKVLAYLHTERNLTDAQIRAAHIGFYPKDIETDLTYIDDDGKQKQVKQVAGITLPWFDKNGNVRNIRTRRIVGNLAKAMGVPDHTIWVKEKEKGKQAPTDKWKKVKAPKYSSLRGGSGAGLAYGVGITPQFVGASQRPVLIVEGEFDALVAAQALPSVTCLTFGSASASITQEWVDALTFKRVILALDTDKAGQSGALSLADRMRGYCELLQTAVPNGKDITDFVLAGGDLSEVVAAATPVTYTPKVTSDWPEHLPRQFERVVLRYMAGSVAVVLRGILLARKQGFMTESFTRAELTEELGKLGIGERAVKQGLEEDDGVFFARPDELKRNWRVSDLISESIGSSVGTLTRQFRQKGRPATEYSLRLPDDAIQQFVERVLIPRLTEQEFKDGGVPPIDDGLLDVWGVEDEETRQTIRENLAGRLTTADHEKAAKVSAEIGKVIKSLRAMRNDGASLEGNWFSAAKYREAVIRREIVKANGAPLAQATLAARTGISERTVQRIYQTQVEALRNWRPMTVRPEDVSMKVSACGGLPHILVSVPSDAALPDATIRVEADGTPFLVKREGGTPVHITTPDGEIPTLRRVRANEDAAAQEAANGRRLYLLTPAPSSARVLTDDELEARKLDLDAKRRAAEERRVELAAQVEAAEDTEDVTSDEALPARRYTAPGFNPVFAQTLIYRFLARIYGYFGTGEMLQEQIDVPLETAIEMLAGRYRRDASATSDTRESFDPSKASTRAALAENKNPGRGRAEFLATLTADQRTAVEEWEAEIDAVPYVNTVGISQQVSEYANEGVTP